MQQSMLISIKITADCLGYKTAVYVAIVSSWSSQWGSYGREVHSHTCYCSCSLNNWETLTVVHTVSEYVLSFLPSFVSTFLEVFLWLEAKFSPCSGFLNHENVDFLILMRDICVAIVLDWVLSMLPEMWQKLRMQILYNGILKILGQLVCAYLHPPLGADKVSG
jgi:hypothetical protein